MTLYQERVAYLQQQLQKEEELAVSAKARLEQAQAARVVAEEDLAKQEALFADKQVIWMCDSGRTVALVLSLELRFSFPKQLRIQEADAMLTRGRAVQESVKGALSELQSVVQKLQVHLLPACSRLTPQHHGAGHKALEGRCSDRVGDSAQ